MTLKEALSRSRISYSQMAKRIGIAKTSMSRTINYGEYPLRVGAETIQRKLSAELSKAGVDVSEIEWPAMGVRPGYNPSYREARIGAPVEAHVPVGTANISTEEIDLMQLDRNVLSLFGLRTNPFLNDVEAEEDVFQTKGYHYVTQAIRDAIEQRGFIAVCAESGAGKTTIWDGIESEFGAREDTGLSIRTFIERPDVPALLRALLPLNWAFDTAEDLPSDTRQRAKELINDFDVECERKLAREAFNDED